MSLPSFMKQHSRIIFYTALLIIITLGILYIIDIKRENQDLKDKVTSFTVRDNKAVAKIVNTYIDTSGRAHTVIEKNANKITEKALKDGAVSIGILDTAAKALKIAKEQIDQLTNVNFQLSQNNLLLKRSVDKEVIRNDSLKKQVSSFYKDKYLNMALVTDSLGNQYASYSVYANLKWLDYHKKKVPLIGQDFYYTDFYSDNPNLKLVGDLQRVTIEHKLKTFGVKLKVSSIYNFYSKQLYPAIGTQVNIGRFDVTGFYNYDFGLKKSIPTVRLDYNLLTF